MPSIKTSSPQTTRNIPSGNTGDKGVSLGPNPRVVSLELHHLATPPTNTHTQDYQKCHDVPDAISPRSPLKLPGSPSTDPVGQAITANGRDVPRRNSLGDLKTPKIRQVQITLRDLGMVREFASSVNLPAVWNVSYLLFVGLNVLGT